MASGHQCSRCDAPSITRTRGENFCEECYIGFLRKKVRAIMSSFRIVGSDDSRPPKIHIYLSFGLSSLALLSLLDDMQEIRKKKYNGMIGFDLECIHFTSGRPQSVEWPWENIKLRVIQEPSILDDEQNDRLSRSSKHDLREIAIRRAAIDESIKSGAIAAFGYTMTKLSELTVAQTIKGRGPIIPSLVSPDISRDHAVYPLREMTVREVREYCRIRGLEKYKLEKAPIPGITKLQSVDEIVRQYFAEVQENFPSVVSTVSKVASRLSQKAEPCFLCRPPHHQEMTSTVPLCYACQSSVGNAKLSMSFTSRVLQEYEL